MPSVLTRFAKEKGKNQYCSLESVMDKSLSQEARTCSVGTLSSNPTVSIKHSPRFPLMRKTRSVTEERLSSWSRHGLSKMLPTSEPKKDKAKRQSKQLKRKRPHLRSQ